MQNVTVTCGCTRQMSPDTLRGHGAFRCGCGARVAIKIPPASSCVGQDDQAGRCRYLPVRESAEYGVPLCRDHLTAYRDYRDTIERNKQIDQAILDAPKLDPRYLENTPEAKRSLRRDLARERGSMVVYYVRIGENIKIGWTANLKQRMTTIMPDEILATEPGEEQLERLRHQQFAHLRVPPGRERFRPESELLDHIKMLRSHYGPPSKTFPPPGDEEAGLAQPL